MAQLISGRARELACLALGHEDKELAACPSTDEELMAQLTQAVQSLRSQLGAHPDDGAQENALAEAMTEVAIAELPAELEPGALLEQLSAQGWHLVRAG